MSSSHSDSAERIGSSPNEKMSKQEHRGPEHMEIETKKEQQSKTRGKKRKGAPLTKGKPQKAKINLRKIPNRQRFVDIELIKERCVPGKAITDRYWENKSYNANCIDPTNWASNYSAVACCVPDPDSDPKSGYGVKDSMARANNIRFLHKKGADVWESDADDVTPLMWATQGKNKFCLQAILECASIDKDTNSINLLDGDDRSALTIAVGGKWHDGVEILRQRGARVTQLFTHAVNGKSVEVPLHIYALIDAASSPKDVQTKRVFLTILRTLTYEEFSIADSTHFYSLLHYAAILPLHSSVLSKILARAKAVEEEYRKKYPNLARFIPALLDFPCTGGGKTPLMLAAEHNNPNAAKMLVDAGADINAKDQKNRDFREFLKQFSNTPDSFSIPLPTFDVPEPDADDSDSDTEPEPSSPSESHSSSSTHPSSSSSSSSSSPSSSSSSSTAHSPRSNSRKSKYALKKFQKLVPEEKKATDSGDLPRSLKFPQYYKDTDVRNFSHLEVISTNQFTDAAKVIYDAQTIKWNNIPSKEPHIRLPRGNDIERHFIHPSKNVRKEFKTSNGQIEKLLNPKYQTKMCVKEITDPEHHIFSVIEEDFLPVHGVFARGKIKRGDIFGEFRGQIKTEVEADSENPDTRSFSFSCISKQNGCPTLLIDASKYCCETTMVNDPTDALRRPENNHLVPNCEFKEVLVNNCAKVFLHAVKDIAEGQEILCYYGKHWWKRFFQLVATQRMFSISERRKQESALGDSSHKT